MLLLLALAVSAAAAQATDSPPFTLVRAYPAIPVEAPVFFAPAGDGSGRLIVAEKSGLIRVFHPAREDTGAVFIDLRPQARDFRPETGLLGLAFHPRFAANGRFFVHYSGAGFRTVLSEFRVSGEDPDRADPRERVLLVVPQPTDSHNGGHIEFGPDGHLYMGLGDGGGEEGVDRYDHGQDLTTLLGAILRIDVDTGGGGYAIPPDNPFAGNDLGWREEIWAYGLRNPWRFSFDPRSGLIWVGDVGERDREEIDLVERGGNYGWARMEGSLCRDEGGCDDPGLIPPVFEYGREEGVAVIGGSVYQGRRWPELAGLYLFGDFGSRKLWALRRDGDAWRSELLAVADDHVLAFGRDSEGEPLVLAAGGAYRLESAAGRELPPPRLSDTGLFSRMETQEPAAGVAPYGVNAPLWSDGAAKRRYLALPEEGRIRFRPRGAWELPDGTVVVKSFYLGGRVVETRLLIKRTGHPGWDGYSYKWNDEGTEAFLLPVAETAEYGLLSDGDRTHRHYFPSRGQCGDCHPPASGYVLGLRTGQMNRGGQIQAWEREGLFSGELPPPETWGKWPEPADEDAPLEERARAYLAANCANCHRPGHRIRAAFDLRFDTPLADTGILDRARLGNLGVHEARILKPGEPRRSLLYLRMLETGRWRMPPLATALVDTQGARLVGRWIEGLTVSTAVEGAPDGPVLPKAFALLAPYPNPSNSGVSIPFALGASGEVRVQVYNLGGQLVETLLEGRTPAGQHLLRWDSEGRGSGVFVVRLTAGGRTQSRKVMLLR